jgi:lipid-A-disaccharide synthase-like uncharacterized protein
LTWDYWVILGFVAQGLFFMRFFIQWISSEKKKESHIPIAFWYFSLAGGTLLLIYALKRQDPVFIIGQATGLIIYVRNLMLIARSKKRFDFSTVPLKETTVESK